MEAVQAVDGEEAEATVDGVDGSESESDGPAGDPQAEEATEAQP